MKNYEELLEEMQKTYTEHSGVSPDDASDIGIRLKVLAGELFSLYEKIGELNLQLFPQTSTGAHLDMHAELRGHSRRVASFAEGALTFTREQPAPTAVEIPAYTLTATSQEPHEEYYTTQKAIIETGGRSVTVPARAVTGGTEGNAAVGKVNLLMDMLPSVSRVENTSPFRGGSPAETDEELRERLVHSYRNISNGANAAYYYDLAAAKQGIHSVAVLPRKRGRGTVDVVITGKNKVEEVALAHSLWLSFLQEKEINVDVEVYPALAKPVPLSVKITVHGEYEFASVQEQCQQQIGDFITRIGIGKPLRLAHLGKRMLEVDGIENYHFTAPLVDVLPLPQEIIVLEGLSVERQVN